MDLGTSKEWREYIADLEEQARLNPSNGRPASAVATAPTVPTVDRKAELKAKRAKRKTRAWKPSFNGAHRGF